MYIIILFICANSVYFQVLQYFWYPIVNQLHGHLLSLLYGYSIGIHCILNTVTTYIYLFTFSYSILHVADWLARYMFSLHLILFS